MSLVDMIPLIFSGIAVLVAGGSFWTSRNAQKAVDVQLLPKIAIGHSWEAGGERGVYINLSEFTDCPDWVIKKMSVRRTWRNRFRRYLVALGQVTEGFEDECGHFYPTYRRVGTWTHSVIVDRNPREVAVYLHPKAPDCEINVEITLNTYPTPTIKRRIPSRKYLAGQTEQMSV